MYRGLTTSASAMLANERLQQMLSNNLANVNTPGFKSSSGSMLSFPQQLEMRMNYGSTSGTPIGVMGTGVVFQEGVPSFSQGGLTATHRALDVGIIDTTRSGPYASIAKGNTVQSAPGQVTVGAGGRLSVNGTPLAVFGPNNKPVNGIYAIRNPAYKGGSLTAADGLPNYDSSGNPSYVFANTKGQILGAPGQGNVNLSIRVGTSSDMGPHSFFAVAYQSPAGPKGIALTRDGHFNVNSQNQLVDVSGNAVLPIGANGKVLYNDRIVLNPKYQGKALFSATGSPVIDQSGQPSYRVANVNGAVVNQAQLGTVNADVTNLTPLGQTEFMLNGTLNPTQVTASLSIGNGQLRPGELEQSNVNLTTTMAKMLSTVNLYTANQTVVQTEDSMLQDAVQKVGVVP